jgi:hypothetical protein
LTDFTVCNWLAVTTTPQYFHFLIFVIFHFDFIFKPTCLSCLFEFHACFCRPFFLFSFLFLFSLLNLDQTLSIQDA